MQNANTVSSRHRQFPYISIVNKRHSVSTTIIGVATIIAYVARAYTHDFDKNEKNNKSKTAIAVGGSEGGGGRDIQCMRYGRLVSGEEAHPAPTTCQLKYARNGCIPQAFDSENGSTDQMYNLCTLKSHVLTRSLFNERSKVNFDITFNYRKQY